MIHEPSRTTRASGARVCVSGAANAAPCSSQRAADAALELAFQKLCQTWRKKPDGINEKPAKKAFLAEIQKGAPPEGILASAEKWAAATSARYMPKLELWLGNGAWKNEPRRKPETKSARGGRKGGKPDLAEMAAKYGGLQ